MDKIFLSKNRKVFWWLILSHVFYVLFLLVWAFFSGMSVMMFDMGIDMKMLTLYFGILAYPLAVIFSILFSWVFYRKAKYRISIFWSLLPLIWIIPIGGFLIYANLR